MTLFEIETGRHGASYERCYVWTSSPARARELFMEANPGLMAKVTPLFSAGAQEFITVLDTDGFAMPPSVRADAEMTCNANQREA